VIATVILSEGHSDLSECPLQDRPHSHHRRAGLRYKYPEVARLLSKPRTVERARTGRYIPYHLAAALGFDANQAADQRQGCRGSIGLRLAELFPFRLLTLGKNRGRYESISALGFPSTFRDG
jgi:hypothetical protein